MSADARLLTRYEYGVPSKTEYWGREKKGHFLVLRQRM